MLGPLAILYRSTSSSRPVLRVSPFAPVPQLGCFSSMVVTPPLLRSRRWLTDDTRYTSLAAGREANLVTERALHLVGKDDTVAVDPHLSAI